MDEGRPQSYQYHYPIEKLYLALDVLVGSGDIRTRLRDASMNLIMLEPHDFPPDLQEEWTGIWRALTWRTDEFEGALEATTRTLSDEEATNLAKRIVGMFYSLAVLENM